MNEKMPTLEELTKLAAENGVELPDDLADVVAGGVYDPAEWAAMTDEERNAARARSMAAKIVGAVCELDKGVDPHNMP